MAVTKQTYNISGPFTTTDVATALRSALIDAGLMTEWYDTFTISGSRLGRVLQIIHDPTKTYGTCFYCFIIDIAGIGVSLATNGWDNTAPGAINVPTGTQYLDWQALPANSSISTSGFANGCTPLLYYSLTSNLALERYTSASDTKQSWFVFRQTSSVTKSKPFSFLHKDTALHSWLNLNNGCISGFSQISCAASALVGLVNFQIDENLRRCLSIGTMLRGNTTGSNYHDQRINMYSYTGVGAAASYTNNYPSQATGPSTGATTPLPVGKNSANPEYTSDYVPACSNIPWSFWTPTRLADDFAVYMRYDANDIALGDRFVAQTAINEWEVLNFANNTTLNDGASASFLARII
jgi:hypothetical protein